MRVNSFNLISNLDKLIDDKQISKSQLENDLQLPEGIIQTWINNHSIPLENLTDLLNYFNISPNELFYNKEQLIQSHQAYFNEDDLNNVLMNHTIVQFSKILNIRFSFIVILLLSFCLSLYINFVFTLTNSEQYIPIILSVLLCYSLYYIFLPRKKIYINYNDIVFYKTEDTKFLQRSRLKKILIANVIIITLSILYSLFHFLNNNENFYAYNLLIFCMLWVFQLSLFYIPEKLRDTLTSNYMGIINKNICICIFISAIYGSSIIYLFQNNIVLSIVYPVILVLSTIIARIYKANYAKYQLVIKNQKNEIKKINL